jgi:hypothetical protein
MAEPKNSGSVKTLALRLKPDLHAQFALVAQLDELSLTEVAIQAVELYVSAKQAQPDFKARAAAALQEIEAEANARRTAIQSLFGESTEPTTGAKAGPRRGKGEESSA